MRNAAWFLFLAFYICSCAQSSNKQNDPVPGNKETAGKENTGTTADTAVQSRDTAVTYKMYRPCSFSVSLPASFSIKAMEPESSPDYCDYAVKTADGFELLQMHSLIKSRFMFEGVSEFYAAALKDTALNITYTFQKGNWFVISGKVKSNNNSLYWKRVVGEHFVSDLQIEYPDAREKVVKPYIAAIAGSFTSE